MAPAGQTAKSSAARIGRYAVTGRIGKGGMGMVYRAWDEALEREVAVKTLTAEGGGDAESRKRFAIEAKAAARLQHPNILTVFELGEDRGVPFIAMELLPGADLEALLRSGEELLLQEKLEIVIQVLRGLGYAHERGIVHRDIKPSNIRVLDDGAAKIMDFGIAKLQGTTLTQTGMMIGTVHYMSPEQIQGRPLDGRSDVFSVGVILYELLAGERPFPGEAPTEVLYKILQQPTPPLPRPDALGGAGARLGAIVERALAKEPAARFAGALAMADSLAEALSELPRSVAAPSPAALETLRSSRRLLSEGRAEESVRRLREVVASDPDSLDLRRTLRAAVLELRRQERAVEPDDGFRELGATFQAPPTRRQPETAALAEPTQLAPPPGSVAPAGGTGLRLTLVAVILGLLGAGLAAFLALRAGSAREPPPTVPAAEALAPEAGVAAPLPAAPVPAEVRVVVEPGGASVALDGVPVGTSPLSIRVDPRVEHRLSASYEGHAPGELLLPAGTLPGEVRLTLQPTPLGSVVVASAYPLELVFRGRVVARGREARASLPAGRQTVTLVSPEVFLRVATAVEVRAAEEARLEAPGLGRLNVRATPDNCEVFVDGSSAGYLPILERPIAAGSHSVSFRWPDGASAEQALEVQAGRPAFVMGRRE